MRSPVADEVVSFEDVEVVANTYGILLYDIKGKHVGFRATLAGEGTQVRERGDRGVLIVPRTVARNLGLV